MNVSELVCISLSFMVASLFSLVHAILLLWRQHTSQGIQRQTEELGKFLLFHLQFFGHLWHNVHSLSVSTKNLIYLDQIDRFSHQPGNRVFKNI
jgi:hypothetical protein